MTSTAADMARYVQMLLNEGELDGVRVLRKETVEQLFTPVIASEVGFSEMAPIDPQSGFAYTPGWASYHYNGYQVIEKGGARAGVRPVRFESGLAHS